MRGELCPYDHGNDPLVVEDVNIPGIVLGFPRAAHPAAFIPDAAALNPAGQSVSIFHELVILGSDRIIVNLRQVDELISIYIRFANDMYVLSQVISTNAGLGERKFRSGWLAIFPVNLYNLSVSLVNFLTIYG